MQAENVDPEYLFWYLYSDEGQRRILEHFKGSAQGGITRDFAKSTHVPLAPQELQTRLAPLLRTAFDYRLSAETHLASARHAIERFCQAVLAAACYGRLTADWRRTIGPVHGSVSETTEHPNMPNVPGTWSYRRLDEIVAPGAAISYGIVLPGPEIPDGVPYVRQQDVARGTVLVDQLRRTKPEIAAKHDRSSLRQGDILLCIIRNLRVAIVPAGLDGANITQGMVRIRPGAEVVGEYLAAYLESPHAQHWMKDQYIGLAMPRINVADARAIPVPLPPLEEQVEIVSRLSSLLSFVDSLQRRLTVAEDHIDRSSHAFLAKAFRGELTPPKLSNRQRR